MSLQGTLKTLGITDVLEFLSTRSASGLLEVTTEMGTAAYGLIDGVVVESDYSFIRESGTDAAEATYYVVSELDGTFFFDDDSAPDPTDEGEDVPSLLSRAAEIADHWIEVEEAIPTANHRLIQNNELDGSVTIEPEWWKALQVIGDGRTSIQLASALEMSVLDASLIALAMTNAGLFIVRDVDPIEIEVDSEFASIDESPVQDHPLDSLAADDVDPEQTLAVVEVEEPTPISESSWKSATAPMSFSNLERSVAELADMAEATQHDEFAGRSGMDDLSKLEYMVEPEGFVSSDSKDMPAEPSVDGDAPVGAQEMDIDDDGWSNGHVSAYNGLQPMSSAPTPEPAPAPPSHAYLEETPDVESPSDEAAAPGEVEASFDAPVAPMSDVGTEMSLEDLPAPPTAQSPFDGDLASVPDTDPETDVPAVAERNAATTAMAGEVIEDLASLSDDLDDSIPEDTNWELDGTFVPETNPAPPEVEGDPFGDLGELLNETAEDERGSVLKFLRRD
jgi:hypothetical protein